MADENEKIETERKYKQEKMFEEARIDMIRKTSFNLQESKSEVEKFKMLEKEISKIAKKYSDDWCKKFPDSEENSTLELYKVLILPEKSILKYFQALKKCQLKRELRKYTILLHPDKNSHPKAKLSFQKMYSIFSKVLEERKKSMNNSRAENDFNTC